MTVQELIDILVEFDPLYDIKVCSNKNPENADIITLDFGKNDYEVVINTK